MKKRILTIIMFLLVLSLGVSTAALANTVTETAKTIDFENLEVSENWDAAAVFTLDAADGNYGQDPAGTWTSIVEHQGSKMLKFETKTVGARKMLRLGYTNLDKFTFSFDFKVDFATITTGQFAVVPAVRLEAGTNWESHSWEPAFVASIYETQNALQSKFNFRPWAEVGTPKNITPDDFHKITVTGDGAAINVYSDYTLLQTYTTGETNYTQGDVGILIYGFGNAGGETVYIDNVSVKTEVIVPAEPPAQEKAQTIDFSKPSDLDLFAADTGFAVDGISKAIDDGKLKFSITDAAAPSFLPLKLNYTTLPEFTYSMDFEFSADTKDLEFSALSRVGSAWSDKSVECNVKVADNGQYKLLGMTERPYKIVGSGQTFTDGEHNLTVSGVDGVIRMYIDDTMVYYHDAGSGFNTGNLGLMVSGTNGTLYIDNVEIKLSAEGYTDINPENEYTVSDTLDVSYETETGTDIFKKNVKDPDNGGTLKVENKELQIKLEPTNDWQGSAWRVGQTGENFTLTVDFALKSGMLGICVRVPHGDSWGTTSIMMQANGGKILLFSYIDGIVKQYGNADYGYMIYYDRYMQLKIVGEGEKITMMLGDESYIDLDIGNIVDGAPDAGTPATGEVAFVAYASKKTENAEAYVKNIKLTPTADYTRPVILGAEEGNPDEEAALAVTQSINNLPAVKYLKLSDKTAVLAARTAYNVLTATQKTFVSADILDILIAAEAKIAELEKGGNEEGKGCAGCSSDLVSMGGGALIIVIGLTLMAFAVIRKKRA